MIRRSRTLNPEPHSPDGPFAKRFSPGTAISGCAQPFTERVVPCIGTAGRASYVKIFRLRMMGDDGIGRLLGDEHVVLGQAHADRFRLQQLDHSCAVRPGPGRRGSRSCTGCRDIPVGRACGCQDCPRCRSPVPGACACARTPPAPRPTPRQSRGDKGNPDTCLAHAVVSASSLALSPTVTS